VPLPPSHGPDDADELARRRGLRAPGEDLSPEQRVAEAEQRLGELAAERDGLRERVGGLEREVRNAHQREWSEQQQRLEAQGEAAASRDVSATRLASLRERLAEAESELATASAERDRAREALEELRLPARAQAQRLAELESEHADLRTELERRGDLAAEAATAVRQARTELRSRRTEGEGVTELRRRLEHERRRYAEKVRGVEAAVLTVRDRLAASARIMQERLAQERAGRVEAESALAVQREASRRARMETAWLEGELARRAEAEAQLRGALEALRSELDDARSDDGTREARLTVRVEAVQAIAASLRDGMRRELDAVGEGVRAQAAAEQQALGSALAAMQQRVAELQEGRAELDAVRAESKAVRADLEAERAARWVAEEELAAERRRGDEDREARQAAEARLTEVESELQELRRVPVPRVGPDPEALAALRETLEQLKGERPPVVPGAGLSLDLAAAAERLRAAVPEHLPEEEVDPQPVAETSPAPLPRHTIPALGAVADFGPWLRDALVGLAREEPASAELMLLALLRAQGGTLRHSLTYDLAVEAGGVHRVVIGPDGVFVTALAEDPKPQARVSGSVAALAPLATGGAARRLPGTSISGRRALRRLIRTRRRPVGLQDLVTARPPITPDVVLTLLARTVPPSWAAGRPLTVDVAVQEGEVWRLSSSIEGVLSVAPAEDEAVPDATLHTTPTGLLAVLAGTAFASVEGNVDAARTVLSWLHRAQRSQR
jgi:hypothetical protein